MRLTLCIVEFAVADIVDIEWSSRPFDCLEIPDKDKEIIIALAESRTGQLPKNTFDDFVTGKGRGLNVLLQYVLWLRFPFALSDTCKVGPQVLERL
jgi:hypothetical protein